MNRRNAWQRIRQALSSDHLSVPSEPMQRKTSNPNITGSLRTRNSLPCVRKISSPESGRSLQLDQSDMKLITTFWDAQPDKSAFAKEVFGKIFEQKPEIQKIFEYSRRDPTEHFGNFSSYFDKMVELMKTSNCQMEIIPHLRSLGVRHARIRFVTFDASNWLLFKNSILEAVTQRNKNPKLYLSWSKLLAFMLSEIKDAFNAAVRNNFSSSLSSLDVQSEGEESDEENDGVIYFV